MPSCSKTLHLTAAPSSKGIGIHLQIFVMILGWLSGGISLSEIVRCRFIGSWGGGVDLFCTRTLGCRIQVSCTLSVSVIASLSCAPVVNLLRTTTRSSDCRSKDSVENLFKCKYQNRCLPPLHRPSLVRIHKHGTSRLVERRVGFLVLQIW